MMATLAVEFILPSIVPFPVPRPLQKLLSRALGIEEIARVYDHLQTWNQPGSIADRLLKSLGISFVISSDDVKHIPETGPAIITANHPFGMLDGAILASLLTRVRPDVRLLANGILTVFPELGEIVIAVDPISGRSAAGKNRRGLRESIEHLRKAGMLAIFPAGEVAHFRWRARAVVESEWNPAVARLVRMVGAPVVPMYISQTGQPSRSPVSRILRFGLRCLEGNS